MARRLRKLHVIASSIPDARVSAFAANLGLSYQVCKSRLTNRIEADRPQRRFATLAPAAHTDVRLLK